MTDLRLGIDIGTTGIRAVVLDPSDNVLAMARTGHESQPDPERIDAMAWWRATQTCLTALISDMRAQGVDPSQVGHIAVDGTSGTMVLTDAALVPVTRALMYNSKGFAPEAERIKSCAPETHITQGSSSALARALRLQGEDTDSRAVHLLHQADFIAAHLMGHGGLSDHHNALKTGFDPETGTWPDWADQTGLRTTLLPKVLPVGVPFGTIDAALAQQLGVSAKAQIHAGSTDSAAAFFACAPLAAGAAVTSLGTTLAIKVLSPARIDAPEIGLYSHRIGDQWLVGGASNTGGGVLQSLFDTDQIIALSQRIDPDQASDLDYYPLVTPGERFPFNDPDLAPRLTPRPDDDAAFLHGIFESIARIEKQCYDAIIQRGGVRPSVLFTAGGGASNPVWTAIRARVLGMTPTQAEQTEASVGVARLIRTDQTT